MRAAALLCLLLCIEIAWAQAAHTHVSRPAATHHTAQAPDHCATPLCENNCPLCAALHWHPIVRSSSLVSFVWRSSPILLSRAHPRARSALSPDLNSRPPPAPSVTL